MTIGGDEAPAWSLQAGIDPETWPEAARKVAAGLRQGSLVEAPPLVYAASAEYPIHATTRAWASSSSSASGAVNVTSPEKRAPWGVIVTQTCDLVEEGSKAKRPWVLVAPVYELFAPVGELTRILQARGFAYLVPIPILEPVKGALWVADLRLIVPVEKGWLVGRKTLDGFVDQAGFDRLSKQLADLFSRQAHATVVGSNVLKPCFGLVADINDRYEGKDPIVEIGLALGRNRLEPVNAQLVFILDGELPQELRQQIIDWWQPVAEQARLAGLETLAPRFVSVDKLSAREYRSLDLLGASDLSPDDEQHRTG